MPRLRDSRSFGFCVIPEDDPDRSKGYLYRTTADYWIDLPLSACREWHEEFLALETLADGSALADARVRLSVYAGYSWDGPSGPTLDTVDFLRASLVHDALYQLLREGVLPAAARADADRILREISAEDGMPFLRRWLDWAGVRLFAGPTAKRKT